MHFTSAPSWNNNDDGSTMEKSRTKKLLHCALAHFCVFILCIFHLCLPSFFFYYIFLGLQLFITLTSSIITNFKQKIYKINVFIVCTLRLVRKKTRQRGRKRSGCMKEINFSSLLPPYEISSLSIPSCLSNIHFRFTPL